MITILFFAGLREEIGRDELQLEQQSITVTELKHYLQKEYNLSSLQQAMVAINESFVTGDDTIYDHDTVAFIPPVSGG